MPRRRSAKRRSVRRSRLRPWAFGGNSDDYEKYLYEYQEKFNKLSEELNANQKELKANQDESNAILDAIENDDKTKYIQLINNYSSYLIKRSEDLVESNKVIRTGIEKIEGQLKERTKRRKEEKNKKPWPWPWAFGEMPDRSPPTRNAPRLKVRGSN